MVGIVIVSHSAALAEGTVELARAMAGPEVAIEAAGGLELPGRPVGTDAALVAKAIDRAWSDEGVLVLMDLGSAVLSAEMALELLPEDRRARVLLCDAPLVEGAVAAAVSAKLGHPLEEVAREARRGLASKTAHLGGGAAAEVTEEPATAVEGPEEELRLLVRNPLGLHARPAARFVETAARFRADVRVENATAGRGPAPARSLTAVASLGVRRGDEIVVRARGREAREALEAIRRLAEAGFGDEAEGAPGATAPLPAASAARSSTEEAVPAPGPGAVLRGLPASPGLALGPARCLRAAEPEIPPARVDDPPAELERLRAAMDRVAAEIRDLRERVAAAGRPREAEIFDAHLLLLSDEALLAPARQAAAAGANPVRAWLDACEDAARAWEAVEDDYLRARAWDLRGIARQVLAGLAGAPPPAIRGEGIVVAADLTPAETVRLDRAVVRGIATAGGGPTSHTAILARSLGIPAVVGLGRELLGIAEGIPLALDGDRGEVHVDPPAEVARGFEARIRERAEAERRARAAARAPAATLDGVPIEVAANLGHPDEAPAAVELGADAVGLFRTEFLFMERDRMPSEEEQEAAYRAAAAALEGRPLTIRTLDVGADKPLPYLRSAPEANPFLGLRGIRLALAEPGILRTQLRAILRVAADHPVRVMFPMVATVRELREARRILEEERARLGGPSLEVGAMIEVPAAALRAGSLAALVEFLSIGTNDLTQYALAAERGNERVAGLADPLHPAVLALVRATVEGAAGHGRWVGVCGEAAGEEAAVPLLVGLGVRELSVAPPRIPAVKEAVRRTRAVAARELALRALELAEADEVRRLVAGASGGPSSAPAGGAG